MVVHKMNEWDDTQGTQELGASLSAANPTEHSTGMTHARMVIDQIGSRIRQDVMGRDDVIELVLVALFAGGHVLLEDYPGSGKTTLRRLWENPSKLMKAERIYPTSGACNSHLIYCRRTLQGS